MSESKRPTTGIALPPLPNSISPSEIQVPTRRIGNEQSEHYEYDFLVNRPFKHTQFLNELSAIGILVHNSIFENNKVKIFSNSQLSENQLAQVQLTLDEHEPIESDSLFSYKINVLTTTFNFIKLQKELNQHYLSPISITNYSSFGYLIFRFTTELDVSKQNQLETTVLLHDPNVWNDRYYAFAPDIEDPTVLDYDLMPLFKKKIFEKGELIRNEHYMNYDSDTDEYYDLVITEDMQNIYDPNLRLIRRTINTINWYYVSGEIGSTKQMTKFYTLEEAIAFEEDVRKRVLDTAKLVIWSHLGEVGAFMILIELENYINLYHKGSKSQLINWWQTTTNPDISQELRQTVLSIINI
jgi:hypothetical protein